MSFKVGDKLKVKESMWTNVSYSRYGFNKDTYQIVSTVYDGLYPSISFVGSGYRYDAAYFELVEEEKVKTKFAVGDKVISTKNTPNIPEGFIGHIFSADKGPNWDYMVQSVKDQAVEYFNEDELELLSVGNKEIELPVKPTIYDTLKPDVINSPKHYAVFEQVEAIQVIASSMTQEQFYGYCLGNCLKYRLRAGAKDDVMQELAKANKYQELYTQHKHLCKEVK